MESLLEILAALSAWRMLVSVGVAFSLALGLSLYFEAFTAPYCISLVILGTSFGVIWQARAEAGIGFFAPVLTTQISKPVTFLGLLLIGFLWGNLFTFFLGSQWLGGIALICSVVMVGLWYCFVLRRPVSIGYLAFACMSLLLGFTLPIVLMFFNV